MSSPSYPQVSLLGVDSVLGGGRLVIEMRCWPGDQRWFSTADRGRTWEQLSRVPCRSIGDYANPSNCLRSRAASTILYKSRQSDNGTYLERSMNGGLTWIAFAPMIVDAEGVKRYQLLDTSPSDAGRVYARIITNRSSSFDIYVSNDYANTFAPLSRPLLFVTESQADSTRLYGLRWSASDYDQIELVTSADGGVTWLERPAARVTFSPFYRDHRTRAVRSWRDSDRDEPILPLYPVYQMECDVIDANVLYILSFKGLFMSEDGGNSFLLLPLATDKLMAIDAIAIDPKDPKLLYAGFNMSQILWSSDRGCHWQQINLPVTAGK